MYTYISIYVYIKTLKKGDRYTEPLERCSKVSLNRVRKLLRMLTLLRLSNDIDVQFSVGRCQSIYASLLCSKDPISVSCINDCLHRYRSYCSKRGPDTRG